ncbi:DUF6607 family protein [Flavobacterium oreochromis]|uniref:Uncharacterized protein n=2 Tax=Flavobacterium TaxID=237 RepID=A0A246GCA1_9FLAO|nr:DUF6607 family protein [Flavobacterium oreochromis]OWP76294.1 hypothetical protein BWG23_08590 [Flavobacterium oreochromis]OWP78652.1 hypothetical protein BWK62_04860 [Flavobacterium oreochromis]POR26535.1 hypothetical protein BWK58_05175 [Flavobacterium columnare]
MKKITLVLLLVSLFSKNYAQDKKEEDRKAIKSMCGCYEVEFNFAETFNYSKNSDYKASPSKHEKAIEWIELTEDQPNKLSLQHLLITGNTEESIVKHWRQDWLYENTDLYLFDKDQTWKYKKLDKKQVAGQWTQKVYQVDDSPRYEGSASWIHIDGRHFWENTADAPLPRREHTIRNDYNLLKRNNIHEIKEFGWVHNQDNKKIIRENNDTLLAEEKGYDVYRKIDDSKCILAQNYWKKNNTLWKNIRNKWTSIFNQNKDLILKKEKQPLFTKLFELKPEASSEEISNIIDTYVTK